MADTSTNSKPSHIYWIVLHIVVPLLPFFAGALIHFINIQKLLPDYSDLALSISAVSLFVRNSILEAKNKYPKQMKDDREGYEEEKKAYAIYCFLISALFFLLFVSIESLELYNINTSLRTAYVMTFLSTILTLILFSHYGKKFGLKARFQ